MGWTDDVGGWILYGLIVLAFGCAVNWLFDRYWVEPPDLVIDPWRLNQEECRLRRLHLDMDDDPVFRAQVKLRMMEGKRCKVPSWYEGTKPTGRLKGGAWIQ